MGIDFLKPFLAPLALLIALRLAYDAYAIKTLESKNESLNLELALSRVGSTSCKAALDEQNKKIKELEASLSKISSIKNKVEIRYKTLKPPEANATCESIKGFYEGVFDKLGGAK